MLCLVNSNRSPGLPAKEKLAGAAVSWHCLLNLALVTSRLVPGPCTHLRRSFAPHSLGFPSEAAPDLQGHLLPRPSSRNTLLHKISFPPRTSPEP